MLDDLSYQQGNKSLSVSNCTAVQHFCRKQKSPTCYTLWESGWCPKIHCAREKGEAYQDRPDFPLFFWFLLQLKLYWFLSASNNCQPSHKFQAQPWRRWRLAVYKDFSKSFHLMKYHVTVLHYSSLINSHYSSLCHFYPKCKLVFPFGFSFISNCTEAKKHPVTTLYRNSFRLKEIFLSQFFIRESQNT